MVEAARLDGAGHGRMLWSILLPMGRPGRVHHGAARLHVDLERVPAPAGDDHRRVAAHRAARARRTSRASTPPAPRCWPPAPCWWRCRSSSSSCSPSATSSAAWSRAPSRAETSVPHTAQAHPMAVSEIVGHDRDEHVTVRVHPDRACGQTRAARSPSRCRTCRAQRVASPRPAATGNAAGSSRSAQATGTRSPDLDVLFVGAHPDDEAVRAVDVRAVERGRRRHDRRHHDHPRRGRRQRRRPRGGSGARADPRGRGAACRRPGGHHRRLQPRPGRLLLHRQRPLSPSRCGATTTRSNASSGSSARPGPRSSSRWTRHRRRATTATTSTPAGWPSRPTTLAGDPSAFPSPAQRRGAAALERRPSCCWAALAGPTTAPGPTARRRSCPRAPTQNIYGVWSGRPSQRYGNTWAQVEREAQREYASQGWAVFPDVLDRSQPARLRLLHPGGGAGARSCAATSAATARPPDTSLRGAVVHKAGASRSAPGSRSTPTRSRSRRVAPPP